MGEGDAELIPIRAERMIAKVAIQVQERTRPKTQIASPFVIIHLGQDVAGGQHGNLLLRIHRQRIIGIVNGDLPHLRLFHHRQRIHLAGILHRWIILPLQGHLAVQILLLFLIFLCVGKEGNTHCRQQAYDSHAISCLLHRLSTLICPIYPQSSRQSPHCPYSCFASCLDRHVLAPHHLG